VTGSAWNLLWPNLKFCVVICLEGVSKSTTIWDRTDSLVPVSAQRKPEALQLETATPLHHMKLSSSSTSKFWPLDQFRSSLKLVVPSGVTFVAQWNLFL
jgi:hypothetical protein